MYSGRAAIFSYVNNPFERKRYVKDQQNSWLHYIYT
jgi:hypothetical protein